MISQQIEPGFSRDIAWRISYGFIRLLSWFVNLFPAAAAEHIARFFGRILFSVMGRRRKVALQNLEIAFGREKTVNELRSIAVAAFEHIAVSFMEVFRIDKILRQGVENIFTIKGKEYFDRALARGKGAVFIVSHIGSWEYLAFFFYLTGYKCSVVVKEVRNPYLFKWINEMRGRMTLNVIQKNNPHQALKAMLRELGENNVLAILIDQWAGNDEPWVDFFGKPASTTTMPARIALKTGCALVPGACIRQAPGKYEITIFPEIETDPSDDSLELTRKLNRQLEAQIRDYAGQWTWTHKRWKGPKNYNVEK